jgi:hypothetical protein
MAQTRNIERKEKDCLSLVCFHVGDETEPTNGRCSQPLILRVMGGEIRHKKDGVGSSGRFKNAIQSYSHSLILRIPRDWRTSCNTRGATH